MTNIEIGARYRIYDRYLLGSKEVIGIVTKFSTTNDGVALEVPAGTMPGTKRDETEVWVRPQQLLRVQDAVKAPSARSAAPVGFVAYVGTKAVNAFHISKLEPVGNHTRVTDLLGNVLILTDEFMKKHTPEVGGYIVMYKDGYTSFSPADPFEEAYRGAEYSLSFGNVLFGLEEGQRYQRAGWNGSDMFIALQTPTPESMMTLPYIWMFTAQGEHVPWLASQSDMLAKDWRLYAA